jgi:putative transposase
VKERAQRRRRLTILFTPTYASWLNQVEIFFNIFTREVMWGGVWAASKRELVDQIMDYIKSCNEEATPFSWNYTGKPLTV